MKIVLISGHDALSNRKTGFHFWMDILAARGVDVRFITVGASRVSLLKIGGKQLLKPFNRWMPLSDKIKKFTWLPLFHPLYLGRGILNFLTGPLFALYPRFLPKSIIDEVHDADIFIVENGAGPLLVPTFRKYSPHACFVYNASDRLSVLKFHSVISCGNVKALPHFNLIRLNAAALAHDFPAGSPTLYIPQAIDKNLFDQATASPYTSPRNAINVGDMLFDAAAIEHMARTHPDWNFHLFGKNAKITKTMPNVSEYGEMAFADLIPYLHHADIGLSPYKQLPDADYLSQSSLKMVQYTYCRLPIVAPGFVTGQRAHAFAYDPKIPESMDAAFSKAIAFDRNSINRDEVISWPNVLDQILDACEKRKK